jgi:zinc transporter ZupT
MAFNPNYVPWMSVLGILGLGIGYLVGGGGQGPEGMIPGLYGLVIGSVLGVVVRMLVRRSFSRRQESKEPPG